jgi:hypothetical protein
LQQLQKTQKEQLHPLNRIHQIKQPEISYYKHILFFIIEPNRPVR